MSYDLNGLGPLSSDDIRRLPAEALAYLLLPRLLPSKAFRRGEMVKALGGGKGLTIDSRNVAAALQVLVHDGVLVMWPHADPSYSDGGGDMMMVTAWGDRVHAAGEHAPSVAKARRRLGVDLHPALAPKLRDSIAVGAFENAAWLALRSVETRVRKLAGDPRNDRGSRLTAGPLMDHAFNAKNGVLSDPDVEQGEREGQMYLFKGAFLGVRNTLSHTDEEQWNDSIEAAEYVLLGDLLMRRLDHVEQRLARQAAAEARRAAAEAALAEMDAAAEAAHARAAATGQAAGIAIVAAVGAGKAIARKAKG